MKRGDQFLQRIVKVAAEIASDPIERVCDGLEGFPTVFGQAELTALLDGFPQPEVRSALSSLMADWREQARDTSPGELALALRAANATEEFHRLRQSIELVWSGPLSGSSAFRRTDQALLELIQSARSRIMVVTFAAYKVPAIAAALVDAAKRGVKISLILESNEESEGAVTFNAVAAMGAELASASTVYAWPKEKREMDGKGGRGALHVKCAVADDDAVMISSANLTDHAMNLNMELGLMVRGGPIPKSLGDHLRSLIQSRILIPESGG